MIVAIQLLVAIVGLLVYVLSSNTKVGEIGRIMFAMGLLAFLLNPSLGIHVASVAH